MVWGLRTQASRSTGVSPYFLVYGSKAILLADIAFRAPRVEHYNEEQATVVQTEDIDRAKEECLITCIRTAKYLEGLRRFYNRNIKGRSFAVGDLVLHRKQKTEGMHKLSSPGKGLTSSKRLLDQGLTGYVTWRESISPIHAHQAPYTFLSLKCSRYVLFTP